MNTAKSRQKIVIPPIYNNTNNVHQQQYIDLHTANLKFMNNTQSGHLNTEGAQAKIKIADLNNALDNIMALQGKTQSPKHMTPSKDINHISSFKMSP